jgi:hypothetical protein
MVCTLYARIFIASSHYQMCVQASGLKLRIQGTFVPRCLFSSLRNTVPLLFNAPSNSQYRPISTKMVGLCNCSSSITNRRNELSLVCNTCYLLISSYIPLVWLFSVSFVCEMRPCVKERFFGCANRVAFESHDDAMSCNCAQWIRSVSWRSILVAAP